MASSEPKSESARLQAAALVAMNVGIVLAIASFLPMFQSAGERWTKDRAIEYQEASLAIQNLGHEAATQSPEMATRAQSEKLNDALTHFRLLQQELETARSESLSFGVLLRVVGVLSAIGGAICYIAWRPTSPETIDHASKRFSTRS